MAKGVEPRLFVPCTLQFSYSTKGDPFNSAICCVKGLIRPCTVGDSVDIFIHTPLDENYSFIHDAHHIKIGLLVLTLDQAIPN